MWQPEPRNCLGWVLDSDKALLALLVPASELVTDSASELATVSVSESELAAVSESVSA
jgi:hypothetical protein